MRGNSEEVEIPQAPGLLGLGQTNKGWRVCSNPRKTEPKEGGQVVGRGLNRGSEAVKHD